jgi:hypothetical protein
MSTDRHAGQRASAASICAFAAARLASSCASNASRWEPGGTEAMTVALAVPAWAFTAARVASS